MKAWVVALASAARKKGAAEMSVRRRLSNLEEDKINEAGLAGRKGEAPCPCKGRYVFDYAALQKRVRN